MSKKARSRVKILKSVTKIKNRFQAFCSGSKISSSSSKQHPNQAPTSTMC